MEPKFTWPYGVVNTLHISLFPASCFDANFIYFYNLNCPIISVYGNKEPIWTLAAACLSTLSCIQKILITLFLLCRGLCFRAGCPGLRYRWVLWRSTVTFTFFSHLHLLINDIYNKWYIINLLINDSTHHSLLHFSSSLISGQCSGLKVFPSELKSNWYLWSSAHCALVCFALIEALAATAMTWKISHISSSYPPSPMNDLSYLTFLLIVLWRPWVPLGWLSWPYEVKCLLGACKKILSSLGGVIIQQTFLTFPPSHLHNHSVYDLTRIKKNNVDWKGHQEAI